MRARRTAGSSITIHGALLVLTCAAGLIAISCGDSGNGNNAPFDPVCPSGSVTLNPTSITVGGTSQASAPSGFTGGTFSSGDTAVATVSGSTVTGVALGNATISGAGWANSNGSTGCALSGAEITVTALAISSIGPSVFRCDAECGVVTETVSGSGFQSGDTVNITPLFQQFVLGAGVNPGEFTDALDFNTPATSPGPFTFTVCQASNCSPGWSIALTGNQNDLVSLSGNLYNLDRVNGVFWEFDSNANPIGKITTGVLSGEVSAAADATDGLIWANQSTAGQAEGFSPTTGSLTESNDTGNSISDSAVESGIYCGTENTVGQLACFMADGENLPVAYAAAGTEPASIAGMTFGSGTQTETDMFVYDRQGSALYDFVVTPPTGSGAPTITLKNLSTNPLHLSGLTPASGVSFGEGGWYLAGFQTGPLAGTIALLSAYDYVVVFVDANTMTIIKSVSLALPLPTGYGVPFRMVADETNGRAVVAYANAGASTSTRFLAVYPSGEEVNTLAAVAKNIIAVGLGVSSDGTKIYACQRNQCVALANQ